MSQARVPRVSSQEGKVSVKAAPVAPSSLICCLHHELTIKYRTDAKAAHRPRGGCKASWLPPTAIQLIPLSQLSNTLVLHQRNTRPHPQAGASRCSENSGALWGSPAPGEDSLYPRVMTGSQMFLEVSLQVEKGFSDCHSSVVQNHPLPIYLTNPKHLRNLLAAEVYHHVCSGMIQSLCTSHSGPPTHSAKVQGFRNGWG